MMEPATRDLVRRRAGGHCEYCRLQQQYSELLHHIEHIVARQHGGDDHPDNLALSCAHCNFAKGPNLSGVDPQSGQIVSLFHPRRDSWKEHFRWVGPLIVGTTPRGRATVRTLSMNERRLVELRIEMLANGIEL